MTWEEFMREWPQSAPSLQSKWSKLTEDEIASIGGKRERLVAALERLYGIQKKHAELQVDRLVSGLKPKAGSEVES